MCRGSDLAASGAGNGYVRLWAIKSETNNIQPLYDLPLVCCSVALPFVLLLFEIFNKSKFSPKCFLSDDLHVVIIVVPSWP